MTGRTLKAKGITYEDVSKIKVKLDGKHIGDIKVFEVPEQYHRGEMITQFFQYFPKGHKEGGERFNTLSECKASLETK